VAALATLVDLFAYLGLRDVGFQWWAADVTALSLAAVVGVSAHRRVTLRNDPNLRWIHRPIAFISSITIAGIVDLLVLSTSDTKGWSIKVVAIAAAAVVRAFSNRWFLFQVVRDEQRLPAARPAPEYPIRLSVIIPAYREVGRIADTVRALHGHISTLIDPGDFEIVVVDDGSEDGTAAAATDTGLARGEPLAENRGKGAAVRHGMLVATGRSRVFLDADLAYGPDEVIRVMGELEQGWDVVVGSRRDSRLVTHTSAGLLRDIGGRLVNLATHVLLLGRYRDTQAGCKGLRGDVAELVFSKTRLDGFSFDIEVFHLVERWRLTLKEIPMTISETESSTVNLIGDTLQLLTDIGRIRRWSARGAYTDPDAVAQLPAPVATDSSAA